MSLGKSKAPAAPDYSAAAEKTAAGNVAAINAQTAANRVNQNTPYGSLTYSETGKDSNGNPLWTQNVNLSDTGQKLLDNQNSQSLKYGDIANQGLDQIQGRLGSLTDTSALPAAPINAGQTAQDAIMSRLQPQIEMQNKQFEQQMANQGIAPGSEAYENARRSVSQQQNDQLTQAANTGIQTGLQARQQGIQEQNYYNNAPLNYVNALRTGSQVQNPTFSSVPQANAAAGPNYLGAAQAQYQSGLNSSNMSNGLASNFMGGLMSLGGTLGSAYLSGM